MALGLMSFSVLSPAGAQPQDLSNLSEVPTLAVFDETNSNGVVTPTWTTPGMTTQHPSTGGYLGVWVPQRKSPFVLHRKSVPRINGQRRCRSRVS